VEFAARPAPAQAKKASRAKKAPAAAK
jgi:hypothetical protein